MGELNTIVYTSEWSGADVGTYLDEVEIRDTDITIMRDITQRTYEAHKQKMKREGLEHVAHMRRNVDLATEISRLCAHVSPVYDTTAVKVTETAFAEEEGFVPTLHPGVYGIWMRKVQ